MQNLAYVKSLIEVYEDPGIEVSYTDADEGPKVVTLNDANNWDTALTDGSTLTISVTRDLTPVSITQTDSSTWVNLSVTGEYRITFQFEDDTGNVNSVVRTVTVADSMSPIIELIGNDPQYIPIGGTYLEEGAEVTDEDPQYIIDANIQIVGATGINTSVAGTYLVNYDYTDTSGLTALTQTRTATVFDNTGPVITLEGDSPLLMDLGHEYVEPGYSAYDALGNNITNEVQVSSDIDASVPGNYTVTYVVIDSFGITDVATRSVTVQDYPDLEDVEVIAPTRQSGSDVFLHGTGRDATYSKDYSISNFTEIDDIDNMIQNIYNILFQSPRDRLFNPNFGSRISTRVFDLMDVGTEEEVLTLLKEDIERFEPRALVVTEESFVSIDAPNRKFTVALKVKVPSSNQLQTIGFTINQ